MTQHRRPGDEPDLFDVAAAEETADDVHMVLPHFGTACGLDFLDVSRIGRMKDARLWTLTSAETTCPDCLAQGDLGDLCRQISSRQAPGET